MQKEFPFGEGEIIRNKIDSSRTFSGVTDSEHPLVLRN